MVFIGGLCRNLLLALVASISYVQSGRVDIWECVSVNAPFHDLTKVVGIGNFRAKLISAARFCPFKNAEDFKARFKKRGRGDEWARIAKLLDSGTLCVGSEESGCVDVNRASKWGLKKLEGIDEALAAKIVYVKICPFTSEADMKERILAQKDGPLHWPAIRDLLHLGEGEGGLCIIPWGDTTEGEADRGDDGNDAGDAKEEPDEKTVVVGEHGDLSKHEEDGEVGEQGEVSKPEEDHEVEDLGLDNDDQVSPELPTAPAPTPAPSVELTIEGIGRALDEQRIPVLGLPQDWNMEKEGQLSWDKASGKLSLFVSKAEIVDKTIGQRYYFSAPLLSVTPTGFTWPCEHFSSFKLSGQVSANHAKYVDVKATMSGW